MKKIFTLLFVFAALFCFAQNTFRTGIKGHNYNQLYDLVQLNDGSYVGLGYSEKDTTDVDFVGYCFLVKLNAQGQLVSSTAITSPNEFYADGLKLIKTADGNLAVVGSINSAITLYKFTTSLNLIWRQEYNTSSDYNYGTSFLQTSDHGFLLAGALARANPNYSGDNEAGLLIKTDSVGNVVWSKQYFDFANTDSGSVNFNSLILAKDSNYVILATNHSSNSNEYDSSFLIKVDKNGNAIWSRFITTSLNNQAPSSLLSTSDGSLLISGSVENIYQIDILGNSLQYANAMMIKCDASGNIIWAKTGNNSIAQEVNLLGAIEDKDGGYIFTGIVDSTDGLLHQNYFNSRGYIFKVNSSGVPQWTKVFSANNANNQELQGVILTSDGGYAGYGSFLYPQISSIYQIDSSKATLYKFNSNFDICGDVGTLGTFSDLTASATSKSFPIYSITATAFKDSITLDSESSDTSLCGNILPVQLLSFTATLQNKSVNVVWKTTNEINTDHFIVERSNNTRTFTDLQNVGAKNNNSTSVESYATTDFQPLQGTSYYRLKEVNKDGSVSYSNIVSITMLADGMLVISPNPVYNNIHIMLQSQTNANTTFQVSDMSGKILALQNQKINAGANTISIPAASLSKGVYVLKVIQDKTVQTIKFIKR